MKYDVSLQTIAWLNGRRNDESLEISPEFQRRPGRMARGATSPAKAKSSARNGKLGGRPPKFQAGEVAIGGAAAPVAIRGREVEIVSPGTSRASFRVTLDGTEFTVPSWRLERLDEGN